MAETLHIPLLVVLVPARPTSANHRAVGSGDGDLGRQALPSGAWGGQGAATLARTAQLSPAWGWSPHVGAVGDTVGRTLGQFYRGTCLEVQRPGGEVEDDMPAPEPSFFHVPVAPGGLVKGGSFALWGADGVCPGQEGRADPPRGSQEPPKGRECRLASLRGNAISAASVNVQMECGGAGVPQAGW